MIAKSKKHTILRLGNYMLQYRWQLMLALFMTIGSNLFALVGPMAFRVCHRRDFFGTKFGGFYKGFLLCCMDDRILCGIVHIVLSAFYFDDHHKP